MLKSRPRQRRVRESNGDREPAQSIYLGVRYVLYVLKLQTCCMTFIAITPLDFRIMYFFTMSDQYYSTLDRSQSLGGVMLSSCDKPLA